MRDSTCTVFVKYSLETSSTAFEFLERVLREWLGLEVDLIWLALGIYLGDEKGLVGVLPLADTMLVWL